jgi:hypothetical protein
MLDFEFRYAPSPKLPRVGFALAWILAVFWAITTLLSIFAIIDSRIEGKGALILFFLVLLLTAGFLLVIARVIFETAAVVGRLDREMAGVVYLLRYGSPQIGSHPLTSQPPGAAPEIESDPGQSRSEPGDSGNLGMMPYPVPGYGNVTGWPYPRPPHSPPPRPAWGKGQHR